MNGVMEQRGREVQARFPLLAGIRLDPLGSAGGFSGAFLWRSGGVYLRAWPAGEPPDRLRWIHTIQQQARQAGLGFVPALLRTHAGETLLSHAGCCWEAGTWLPGTADYHANPSPARLAAAGEALARIHTVWARETTAPVAPIPGIRRRRHLLHRAGEFLHSGWQPHLAVHEAGTVLLRRAFELLRCRLSEVPVWLDRWATRSLALQPCLCDPWHDHVLYTADRVTGLIDYGAARMDHPSVDLARMLGSLAGDADWSAGIRGYRSVRRLSDGDEELAHVLDRSGTVLSIAHWLERLIGLSGGERTRALARLETLVERVERW